jgi:peptidyl-prolyl cis-trans isomerase SurA
MNKASLSLLRFLLRCAPCLLVLGAGAATAQTLRPSTQLSGPRLPAGNTDNTQRTADYIVAIVNSEPVTNNEVRARVVRFEQQLAQRGGALPTREELMAQVLERLISERAQVQLARDNGIRVDESSVEQGVQNVARQNQISVEELRRRLEADGISYAQFRADIRDEVLLARVREREVDPRVSVSEIDIDRFIREQGGQNEATPEAINIAQILIAVPENATPVQVQALQDRAQRALKRAQAGEDFAALANEFSDAPDRASGGQLGLRTADRYPPLFVETTAALRPGGLAGPVRSGAGFHVLKMLERIQGGLPSMTVTQSRARHILLRLSAQMTESAAIERLDDLRRRIGAGQIDFATAARDNSQDGSARDGGDLGWANPGQFVQEFEEAMNGLAPGEVSKPLVSRFGVHLIQLQQRRQNSLNQREQREIARSQLREKKLEEAFATWSQDVRARAYVELREPPR